MNVRWALLDTTHNQYNAAKNTSRSHHEGQRGNKFSIVLNDAGTQALIKVDGASKAWRKGKFMETVGGVMLAIYDRDDHSLAVELLSGPEWSNTREDT